MRRAASPALIATAAFVVAAVALSPFLFVIYRLSVFHTVPYDDYTGYLLWLAGDPDGRLPASPYCYRLLSMAAAWPLYELLPRLALTNMPADLPPAWVRATLALNVTGYLGVVAAGVMTGMTALRRCAMAPRDGVQAGLVVFALAWYTQITAIDGLALLLIAVGVFLVATPAAFAALVLLSVGVNEKVALVLALWLVARCVLSASDRRQYAWPCAASLAALLLYAAIVAALHLPGHEYQTDPRHFAGTIAMNLLAYVTPRGLTLNLLPVLLLAGIATWAHLTAGAAMPRLFRPADVLVIAGLAGVALVFTELFQAGRIVMHAAPLFAIPVVAALPAARRSG